MRLTELIKSAFSSLWSRKIRSFLTSLGVIIGVFSVAALLSVAESSVREMNESLSILNSEAIEVWINDPDIELTMDDIKELGEDEFISAVAPYMVGNAEINKGLIDLNTSIIYTTSEYDEAKDLTVHNGRFILPIDQLEETNTVVLGINIALKLFANIDVLGETISINNVDFTIIGVLKETPSGLFGDTNEELIIPKSTAERYFGVEGINNIAIEAANKESSQETVEFLNRYLYLKFEDEESYNIYSNDQVQSYIDETSKTLMFMLGGIGGISLLVSGIGIMNIMLVSVRERTREIGIRKAIGARRKDILIQFLVEAIVLSIFGGLTGIGLTYLIAQPVGNIMGGLDLSLSTTTVMISTLFSLGVGVVFGLYPAVKASKLIPVKALRYD
ncbi:ABC transporter permease [Mycoplasmatota bacterium zrk1]